MNSLRRFLVVALVVSVSCLVVVTVAHAAPHHPKPHAAPHRRGGGILSTVAGVATHVLQTAANPGQAVAGAVAGVASGVANSAATSVFDSATKWITDGAAAVIGLIEKAEAATTTPELTSTWFQNTFAYVLALGWGLSLPIAIAGLLSGTARGDTEMIGDVFKGLARMAVLTPAIIFMTLLLLGLSDGLTSDITAAMPATFLPSLHTSAQSGLAAAGGAFASFFVGLFEIAAAIGIWVELVIRSLAIYLAVLLLPVILAMAIFPALGDGAKTKLYKLLGTFIFFKPLAFLVLAAGATFVLGSTTGGLAGSANTLIAGVGVLIIAAVCPWVLLSMFSEHVGQVAHSRSSSSTATGGESYTGQMPVSMQARNGDLPAAGSNGSAALNGSASGASSANGAGGAVAGAGALGGVAMAAQAAKQIGTASAHHITGRMTAASGGSGQAPPVSPSQAFRSSFASYRSANGSGNGNGSTANGSASNGSSATPPVSPASASSSSPTQASAQDSMRVPTPPPTTRPVDPPTTPADSPADPKE